jgi:hypothetical protein
MTWTPTRYRGSALDTEGLPDTRTDRERLRDAAPDLADALEALLDGCRSWLADTPELFMAAEFVAARSALEKAGRLPGGER